MKIYVKADDSNNIFSNPLRNYVAETFFPKFKQAFESAFGVSPNRYSWVPAGTRSKDLNIYFSNIRLKYIVIRLAKRDWNKYKVTTDYDKFDKLRVQQGWDTGIWDINVPYDLVYSPDLVDKIITKLTTLSSFKKYLTPVETKAAKKDWRNTKGNIDFENAWWLAKPENEVNNELQIFPEPSVQGNAGGVFIYDKSDEGRDENGYPWYEDWTDWLDWKQGAAVSSKNAEQYKKKYRAHIKELCGI